MNDQQRISNAFDRTPVSEALCHCATFLRALVEMEIAEFGREGERYWHWSVNDLQVICTRVQRNDVQMRALITTVEQHHPDGARTGDLADAITFLKARSTEAPLPGARVELKPASDPSDGLLMFDGMGSLPADFCGLKDYLLIDPGKPGKEAFRFRGESWREKRRPQRNKRTKNKFPQEPCHERS